MKRRLLLIAIFAVTGLCWFTPMDNLQAQSYFSLTDVTVSPSSPSNYEYVSISLSGLMADSCTYLDSFDTGLYLYDFSIHMDWDSAANPVCNGSMLPWDTTLQLGVLPVGIYTINLSGSNFTDDSGSSLSFEVTTGNAGTCGNNGLIWVTNTDDDGDGSLRSAITCANSNPNPTLIQFDIPGSGPHIFKVGETTDSGLPILNSNSITIDGTTQPGYIIDSPQIFLDGKYTPWTVLTNGLVIKGDHCGIYGLDISNFPDNGILIDGALFSIIGAPDKGNNLNKNGFSLGEIDTPSNYNVGTGIRLINGAGSNLIQRNYIGTINQLGQILGNEYCGIFIQENCDNNIIGGAAAGATNVIANNANGIRMEATADFNEIFKNVFECNDSIAIKLMGSANSSQEAPVITDFNYQEVKGTGIAGDRIDVYTLDQHCSGAPCQGNVFLGSVIVDAMNEWVLNGPFADGDTLVGGEIITALATNPDNSTSEFASCGVVVGLSPCTDPGGVIWVTNAQDTGVGSLREAMICADNTAGSNEIRFNIPGTGPFTINVGSDDGNPLPLITDNGTIIDGTTQPGYGAGGDYTPLIILNGSQNNWTSPDDALKIKGNYTEIYGLEITDFPDDAIEITSAVHVIIGAAQKGNVIYNNGAATDYFPGAPGQGPFEGSGIALRGSSKRITIAGNVIGTDYAETNTNGNEYCGIFIDYDIDFVTIGGPGKGNVIANNAEGIRIGDESFGTSILQNSFFCNDSVAIRLEGVASNGQLPPSWDDTNNTSLTMLSGQADAGDSYVEIYRVDDAACGSAPCQGRTYIGTAFVVNNQWQLNAPFSSGVTLSNGDLLTATAIDTDANTSEFSACHIAANCSLIAGGSAIINPSCEQENGSFVVATSGGPAPFLFDRGLGEQSSPLFSGLAAGTYTITVTDAYTCITTTTVTLTDPGLPSTSVQLQGGEACDMQNGFVIMNQASGGSGPYSYDIGTGNQGNNPNFINLVAGNYTVTVTDGNGCEGLAPVTIPFLAGPTLEIINVADETCGFANGSFSASATQGTPIYVYSIGGANQNSPNFNGLQAGTYTVTVTDFNTCTDTASVTFVNIAGPSSLIIENVTGDFCGQSNGTVTVLPDGGTESFTYDIGFGQDGSNTFFDLVADNYSITVTDANQCTASVGVTIPAVNGPDLSIESTIDANCGQANGAMTIATSGGADPFLYDIGNGNQSSNSFTNLLADNYSVTVTDANSCTSVLSVTINDIGGPTLSTSSLINASCEQFNGSFTVLATGGVSPFLYDFGNGNTGNPTFTNLPGGDYTVTVTDAANCSSVMTVTIQNIGLLAISDFTFLEDDGTVDFTNTSMNSGGYVWDFGDGEMSSDVNPTHTYAISGDYDVCLQAVNDCGIHTSCQTVSILLEISISGRIEKENGQAVSLVELDYGAANPVMNNPDGTYVIPALPANGNYFLTPEKDINYGNGVSTFDVFKIQQHILFVTLLDSPYKIISADVNHTNTVTTFDTYLMQQVILQNVDTFPNNTSWRFVAADFIFPDMTNPFLTSFPEQIIFNSATQNYVDQDFVAMKIGDVTLDANPAMVVEPPSDKMKIAINDSNLKPGEDVQLAITAKEVEQLAALQFDIQFDQQALTFNNIQTGDLAGLNENDFNLKEAANGLISLAWYDKKGIGQDMNESTVLFYLNFTARQEGNMHDVLSIQSFRNNNIAYQSDGYAMEVKAVFEKEEEKKKTITDYHLSVQPNPFTTYVDVLLETPITEKGQILLYDITGRLLYSDSKIFEKGVQRLRLNRAHFPTKGMYMLQIRTEGFVHSLRVIAE